MNFRKVLALRGPNLWAYFPVLEAWVDLGGRKDLASCEMPGFNERLMAWLPTMIEHRCSVGERGGFFERLRRGTYLAHILEHVTIELQNLAGSAVGFGKARMTGEDGVYKVVVEHEEEELARACLETARELVLAAVEDRSFDLAGDVSRLRQLAQKLKPDTQTAAILQAARKRKIPTFRLEDQLQLGHGIRQQRLPFIPSQASASSPAGLALAENHRDPAPLLDTLFPAGDTGRIPLVAVTGVNGKTTTVRLISHILSRTHRCVGMTCTEGIYIGGQRVETGDCSGPRSAQAILQNPAVDAAVLETARGGILRAGLGFDRCKVAVVTNIADGDHLGIADIDTPEQLALVKRTIVDVVLPDGTAVLKADDPLVAAMAPHCPGSVIFFARDGQHPLLAEQRQKPGRAVFVRDGRIVLAEGDQEIPLAHLEAVPLTHGGRVAFEVENALAASAAAWALGVPCESIRAGLEAFGTRLDETPGRFNLVAVRGATVIMDYGHNVHAISCLFDSLRQLPHARRTAVFSVAGDRRDDDFVRQGELLGEHFDQVLIYEDEDCTRGRRAGETAALLRQGLAIGRRVRHVQAIDGAVRAAEIALDSLQPGDLLLIQVDRIDETIDLVRRHMDREIDFSEAIRMGRPAPVPVPLPAITAEPVTVG